MNKTKLTNQELDIKKNKHIAVLSYFWILCLIPLLGKKRSKFVQFHARQGLVLFIIEIGAGLFSWVPFFGQILVLTLIILSALGVVKSMHGKWWKIPIIYDWSKKVKI